MTNLILLTVIINVVFVCLPSSSSFNPRINMNKISEILNPKNKDSVTVTAATFSDQNDTLENLGKPIRDPIRKFSLFNAFFEIIGLACGLRHESHDLRR